MIAARNGKPIAFTGGTRWRARRRRPQRRRATARGAARPRPADLARGTNQSGVRLYNERLVLSLIRRHGSLPKAEIARLTGLSAQTITVIIRQLESDGLVASQGRQRGKIGQPSVPFALNPDGAFSLGLKIGRRSTDLVLMDLIGGVRQALHEPIPIPSPARPPRLRHARHRRAHQAASAPAQPPRITGIGIAAPFELWNWEEQIGAPRAVLERGGASTSPAEIGRHLSAGRSISATTRPPPAAPSSSSAIPATTSTSSISSSARSSAAASS